MNANLMRIHIVFIDVMEDIGLVHGERMVVNKKNVAIIITIMTTILSYIVFADVALGKSLGYGGEMFRNFKIITRIIILTMILSSLIYHVANIDKDTNYTERIFGFLLLTIENILGSFVLIFLLPLGGWGEHLFGKYFGARFASTGSIIGTIIIFIVGYYLIFILIGKMSLYFPYKLNRFFKKLKR